MPAPIPCFLAINDAYVRHAGVVIVSAACNSTSRLAFFILNSSLSHESKSQIESLKKIRDFDLRYIQMDESTAGGMQIKNEHITIETCYRLLIPTLLPELDKAVYLDADIVVRHDLAELWRIDLGDTYAGVVEDMVFDAKIKDYDTIFPTRRYFNAGVLVMNLKKIRNEIPFARFLEIERRHRAALRHQDQDVLNIAFGGNVRYLPLKWNVTFFFFNPARRLPRTLGFPKAEVIAAREDPAIVHFICAHKPWLVPCGFMSSPYAVEYFKHLDKITKGNSYADAVKKFPRVRDFLIYWWRHPFFFLRPKTYATLKAKRKISSQYA